jgi:hypothetical protein
MDLSNSAKLINMLSVSGPIASAVEKFNVTDYQPLKDYDGKPGYSKAQGQ